MKLGFVGTGKITSSVVTGICRSKISFKKIILSPRNRNVAKKLKKQFKKEIIIVFGCGGERDKPKRKIMGKIANNYCDKIFLTDDNPRYENPKKIRNQIKKKIFLFKKIVLPFNLGSFSGLSNTISAVTIPTGTINAADRIAINK